MAEAWGNYFEKFLDYLFESGDISIPKEYHAQCLKIQEMLGNEISGVINTISDYAINSASSTEYRVECSESSLQELLNRWLSEININIKGIPTGLSALSKEYFIERWLGSSFCVVRLTDWENITINANTIQVPKTIWLANGSSIYVVRPSDKDFKLGSDKLFLDSEHKNAIPKNKDEEIIITKPFDRWHVQYPTPYLTRKGILKNWLGMKTLMEKSDEVISKILPYLFIIQKGSENLSKDGENWGDEELKELSDSWKEQIQKYKSEKGKTPFLADTFDTKYDHLIPDLSKVLKEELYSQGYRAILSGLGFIDVIQGISNTRKESIMNPKPFIAEINAGVDGFKQILLEAIYLIQDRNINKHRKLFSEKGKLIITNSPLKINVEGILDSVRSGFDRGGLSIESYVGTLGFDYTTEKERRKKELDNGDEELMFPHVITNVEKDIAPDKITPTKPKTKKQETLEDENKKPGSPESKKFKNANEEIINEPIDPNLEAVKEDELEIAPFKDLQDLLKKHPNLKKYPEGAQKVFLEVFNSILKETGDEARAFSGAYSKMKKWLDRHGNKKE